MKSNIDLKSAVVGMVLGGILVLSIAAVTTPNSSAGRFQLTAGESGIIFKIDTVTGQVWKTYVTNPDSKFMRANIPEASELEESAAPSKR